MPDYYKERKKALILIDKMLNEKKEINEIYFKIDTLFGFGKKIVDDRIKLLKEINKE